AARTTRRTAPRQPAHRASLSAQGGLPRLLGLRVARLGGAFPRPVDHRRAAVTHRALRQAGSHPPQAPTSAAQLVPSPSCLRDGRRRGLQQQSPRDDETCLRFQELRPRRGRPVPSPRRATRARMVRPQIHVRRRKEYWETEVDTGSTSDDPSADNMPSALKLAGTIHNDLTKANLNAFHYWWLYAAGS